MSSPGDRLLEKLATPMRERGFALRKRPVPSFSRVDGDAEISLQLMLNGKRSLWTARPFARARLLAVERWLKAVGLEPSCELQLTVTQEMLRESLPKPSAMAWAIGLELSDPTRDVPSRDELACLGVTLVDYQHPDEHLDDAATTLVNALDRFVIPALTRICDVDELVTMCREPDLASLRELSPAFWRDGWLAVAIARVHAPDDAQSVAASVRTATTSLDPTIAAKLLQALDRVLAA